MQLQVTVEWWLFCVKQKLGTEEREGNGRKEKPSLVSNDSEYEVRYE